MKSGSDTLKSGASLMPGVHTRGGAVTLDGTTYIYRVVKKGLVTFETMNGQINLTLISF
ncbi:hypothetical protein OP101_004924 [Salmonella enterica]|nr:hypothetical protein [Salmonella enterica]EKC4634944.1 hypothetical protein [Salmonella enterica]